MKPVLMVGIRVDSSTRFVHSPFSLGDGSGVRSLLDAIAGYIVDDINGGDNLILINLNGLNQWSP